MKLKITNYLLELLNKETINIYATLFETSWDLNARKYNLRDNCNYEYIDYSLKINESKDKIHALKSKLKIINESIECIKNG